MKNSDKIVLDTEKWATDDPVAVARIRQRVKEGRYNRREFMTAAAAGAVAVAALGVMGCGRKKEAAKNEPVKTAEDYPKPLVKARTLTSSYIPIVDSTPIPIAFAKGFFKEVGINAEKPVLIRGWAPLMEAFTANQTLLTHMLLFQVIFMRYEQKLPVRSIAFNHLNGVAMLGGKGIKKMSELGGKTVGCPIWWAPHTLLFQECLRAAGLKPVVSKPGREIAADEVSFRVIQPPDMPTSLQTGAISGAVVSEGFGAASELLAGATMLRFSGDVWRNHPCCQSIMMQSTIDQDRSWAEAVTLAIAKACKWGDENPGEMVEILAKDGGGYFPMPKNILQRGMQYVDLKEYGVETGTGAIKHPDWHMKRLGLNPFPYPSAFELAVTLMKRCVVDESVALTQNLLSLDPAQAAKDIVEYEFIRKAISQVGGIAQFDGVNPGDPFVRKEEYDV